VVFAGVDYAAILAAAESEADVVIWDGGNNDFPFVVPDLHIAIVDALRPDQVSTHHPGESVARMADVIVVNKVDAASSENVQRAVDAARAVNSKAPIVRAASPVVLEDPDAVRGRRVIVLDDGPTLTHGGMPYGAGYVAAVSAGAEIVDPRDSADPGLLAVYARFPHLGRVLPAVGYDDEQIASLQRTIEASEAELVVSGSPFDLAARIALGKPVVRARYAYADAGEPTLGGLVDDFLARRRVPA
jgi:predicted GTPase